MKRTLLVLLCCLNSWTALYAKDARTFDFYVMSLSWSPEFCSVKPENRQCGRGYGLVLHGLWPQFTKGYPQSCSAERMPAKLLQSYSGLYPDGGLAFHEWKKHGTCSGLAPEGYLQLSQTLKNSFVSPPEMRELTQPLRVSPSELQARIVAANPALNSDAVVFSCSGAGRFLQEIYVCYDKEGGAASACSAEMQERSKKSCGQGSFLIRNIR